jgi:hypothetical protein
MPELLDKCPELLYTLFIKPDRRKEAIMIYDLNAIAPEYEKARQALTTARAKETRATNAWMALRQADYKKHPGECSPATNEAQAKAKQAQQETAQALENLNAIMKTAPEYQPTN